MSEEPNRTRRRVLQSICGVGIAGLAGCNSTGALHIPPTKNGAAEAPESVKFVENPEAVHPTLVEETTVASDEVLIGFRLEDSSLPFTTEVYRAPDDAEVQATKTYETQALSNVDLVPETPEALDTVETDREDIHYATTTVGEPLPVTLVARHDGETLDWSAWSRTGYPYDGHNEDNPAVKVDCYCGGMTYTAPRGGTWARVIQVTPTERVDPGTTIVLNWTSSRF
ncbi:hypothetical protein [Haloferax larsenii]|uniref:Uncharacterized protein n=1 Tax=Haloferax larsenii TaxID=302484 RepID=A0A1H7U6Z2_HALLR|nr:hypothetical protein [Haloferax larsenii]SEL92486.1 hypothetical protein SAMN04488691_11188 [Haloferax larsenii]